MKDVRMRSLGLRTCIKVLTPMHLTDGLSRVHTEKINRVHDEVLGVGG